MKNETYYIAIHLLPSFSHSQENLFSVSRRNGLHRLWYYNCRKKSSFFWISQHTIYIQTCPEKPGSITHEWGIVSNVLYMRNMTDWLTDWVVFTRHFKNEANEDKLFSSLHDKPIECSSQPVQCVSLDSPSLVSLSWNKGCRSKVLKLKTSPLQHSFQDKKPKLWEHKETHCTTMQVRTQEHRVYIAIIVADSFFASIFFLLSSSFSSMHC